MSGVGRPARSRGRTDTSTPVQRGAISGLSRATACRAASLDAARSAPGETMHTRSTSLRLWRPDEVSTTVASPRDGAPMRKTAAACRSPTAAATSSAQRSTIAAKNACFAASRV